MHARDQHVLVVRPIEDRDLAFARSVRVHPPQEVVLQLDWRGLLEGDVLTPSGFRAEKTCLTVPSLPAASMPCSTMRIECLCSA